MKKRIYLSPSTEIVSLLCDHFMQNLQMASKGQKILIEFEEVQQIPSANASDAVTNISNLWDEDEEENF